MKLIFLFTSEVQTKGLTGRHATVVAGTGPAVKAPMRPSVELQQRLEP